MEVDCNSRLVLQAATNTCMQFEAQSSQFAPLKLIVGKATNVRKSLESRAAFDEARTNPQRAQRQTHPNPKLPDVWHDSLQSEWHCFGGPKWGRGASARGSLLCMWITQQPATADMNCWQVHHHPKWVSTVRRCTVALNGLR